MIICSSKFKASTTKMRIETAATRYIKTKSNLTIKTRSRAERG